MTTVFEIVKRRIFGRGIEPTGGRSMLEVMTPPAVAAWPFPMGVSWFPTPVTRRRLSIISVAVILASAAAYVAAVNVMLLDGEAMKQDVRILAQRRQEYAGRQSALAARESPAWLEARARADGMVDASTVRFVAAGDSVAAVR